MTQHQSNKFHLPFYFQFSSSNLFSPVKPEFWPAFWPLGPCYFEPWGSGDAVAILHSYTCTTGLVLNSIWWKRDKGVLQHNRFIMQRSNVTEQGPQPNYTCQLFFSKM